MINVNRLLQNSVRCELMGKNMFTYSPSENPRYWDYENASRLSAVNVWQEPNFGMSGTLGIGHETNVKDACVLKIYRNGEELEFRPVRNFWSPAYMETYYRCKPFGDYKRSGLVVVKEKKCITRDDVFVSEVTVLNDSRNPSQFEFAIESCFNMSEPNIFSVNAKTVPRALKKIFELNGYMYIGCDEGLRFKKTVEPFDSFTFKYGAVYSPKSSDMAAKKYNKTLKTADIFKQNERSFNLWFEKNVPEFKCENEKILKAYYYRSFLIYKNTFTPKNVIPEHFIKGKTIYESSTGSWYGCPVGLPVSMQIEETKWLRDKSYACEHIENWLRGGGSYQGYIQYTPLAAWHYYEVSGNKEWLKAGYGTFVDFTFKKLDFNDSKKLPVTDGSWLTGAEYQPSFYQHTPTPWDYRYDQKRKSEVGGVCWKLYRLDELFFTAGNLYALENMAKELSKKDDAKLFGARLREMLDVIKERFFDEEQGIFFDVDVKSGKRCDKAVCYDSFVPLMWGLIKGEKYSASLDKLLEKNMLGSEFSVTTAEKHTPMFWPDNAITGPAYASEGSPDFYGCCWNGPVWPFANTLAINAYGETASKSKKRKEKWVCLFENYTDLHYMLGDFSVPDIVEHYRHSDGTPFSVTHDYFHSCYIDLLMKYWAGISVFGGEISFKPYTKEPFELKGVVIGEKTYTFRQYLCGNKLCRDFEFTEE